MTTHRMLWRLDGLTPQTPTNMEQLTDGLALHLTHTDLLTILMRIDAQMRAYLVLEGCAGCARGRCEIGCYADLFTRLLARSTSRMATLHHVAGGLATRAYARAALATPTCRALALDAALLTPWPEARLMVHWRRTHQGARCAALLLVGSAGPDPSNTLRAQGWCPWPGLTWFVQRRAQIPIPGTIAPSWRWRAAPFLLLPASPPGECVENVRDVPLPILPEAPDGATSTLPWPQPEPSGPDGQAKSSHSTNTTTAVGSAPMDDAALAAWLRGAMEQARRPEATSPAAPAPMLPKDRLPALATPDPAAPHATPEDGATPWPSGPGGLAPATMAEVLACLTSDIAFTTGAQLSQIGVVKGRLVKRLGLADDRAAALMVWLDAAGVLAEPYRPEDRWRKPRPLAMTDLAQIAERLRTTPLPDTAMVRAAYAPQK